MCICVRLYACASTSSVPAAAPGIVHRFGAELDTCRVVRYVTVLGRGDKQHIDEAREHVVLAQPNDTQKDKRQNPSVVQRGRWQASRRAKIWLK
eukprot:1108272-Pleurochrysis_carterae.AAC.2